jgi:hypothetical protein
MSDEDLDLAHRRLCPDGACIGVIGEDGRCGVCGRTAGAAADPDSDADSVWDSDADSDSDADTDSDTATDAATATATATDSFDPDRRLCPDGACIGVIGSDGKCKVCGRVATGS